MSNLPYFLRHAMQASDGSDLSTGGGATRNRQQTNFVLTSRDMGAIRVQLFDIRISLSYRNIGDEFAIQARINSAAK